MRHFLLRHQPAIGMARAAIGGLGGAIAIALLGLLTLRTGHPLMMAPFGASCVLLFSQPASPLSQPMNVVFGHLVSTAIGLALRVLLPDAWWAAAIAVGLAIALMSALRVTHPPAGADPLVVFSSHPDMDFLVFPVALGSISLVAVAYAFHRFSGHVYPLRKSA
ncbi:HPP family protein [Rhizobium cremeum]|uniref:HPP family protein n=1 Tax=Rhizobium cremeum TaxID=2813827 RepID=UPI000DE0E5A5